MKFRILLLSVFFSTSVVAVEIQEPAPFFSLNVMANANGGGKLTLNDYRGKVIYLDFWASWCGPCRRSFSVLNELRNKYPRSKFEVIAVNLDEDRDDALAFLQKYKVDYPIVYDTQNKIPYDYKLKGMPTAFLIDRAGVIRYIHDGFKDKDAATIESHVRDLVAEIR